MQGSSNIDSCNIAARRLGDPDVSGSDIRKMDYRECVVICGNEGGIYRKYDIKTHPRYSMISDGASNSHYDLAGKHFIGKKSHTEKTRYSKEGSVVLKETLFDSKEEEILYNLLIKIPDVLICPHQQLRDVFTTYDTVFSMKLSYMHCDFVIRDMQYKVLCGVEIDGNQHQTDREQIAHDSLKNHFFQVNNTPLLRFKAAEVRASAESVAHKIQDKLNESMCIAAEDDTGMTV